MASPRWIRGELDAITSRIARGSSVLDGIGLVGGKKGGSSIELTSSVAGQVNTESIEGHAGAGVVSASTLVDGAGNGVAGAGTSSSPSCGFGFRG